MGLDKVSLRKATDEDLNLLFKISSTAMRPVVETLNPGKVFNETEEFEKFKAKFDPSKLDVIQYEGKDVGRLRIVRSPESIYIGGIQILPEYQGKGIGTALLADLIKEAEGSGLPILLEVHDVNEKAIAFYKGLGFKEGEKIGNQTVMRYLPVYLQKASETDIETLLRLEQSVAGSHTYSPMLEEDEWKEELAKSTVFLIKNGDDVVGSISYEQKSPQHMHISGLVVTPSHQRQGIARDVLTQVLDEHPAATRIELVTHPDNPALKLYESLGFTMEGRKENYYGDGEPRLVLALVR
jgi:ribosomal protein S18 acetylase RimI-like enzyme